MASDYNEILWEKLDSISLAIELYSVNVTIKGMRVFLISPYIFIIQGVSS